MLNQIKSLAVSLLLAFPSIGYCSSNFAEKLIKDTINPSFATYLNRVSATNAYFHNPTYVRMMSYDDYHTCKEVSKRIINSMAEDPEYDGHIIVTDKTHAIYSGARSTETYTNLLLTIISNTGTLGGGFVSYCHKRPDGGAENATFNLWWSEK